MSLSADEEDYDSDTGEQQRPANRPKPKMAAPSTPAAATASSSTSSTAGGGEAAVQSELVGGAAAAHAVQEVRGVCADRVRRVPLL
ncbi:hypothetical protein SRHO_G00329350 [Serrasalmus rhombeus]